MNVIDRPAATVFRCYAKADFMQALLYVQHRTFGLAILSAFHITWHVPTRMYIHIHHRGKPYNTSTSRHIQANSETRLYWTYWFLSLLATRFLNGSKSSNCDDLIEAIAQKMKIIFNFKKRRKIENKF